MSEQIKELKNTPEEAVYRVGKGKDALTLSVATEKTTYKYIERRRGDMFTENRPTNYIYLQLESNNVELYMSSIKEQNDYYAQGDYVYPGKWDALPGRKIDNIKMALAEKLYDDESKEATAVKKFLSLIKGNVLVDEINKLVEGTPLRREEELQKQQEEQARRIFEAQKRQEEVKQKKLTEAQIEAQNKKNAEKTLNNFVGADDAQAAKKETVTTNEVATNKLAKIRKKIAHGIDETLGTKLEEKKLAKPLKKIEKAVSDKLFGKVKE